MAEKAHRTTCAERGTFNRVRIEYAKCACGYLFFGRLKDIVGKSEEDAELSEGARVEDLFARYGRSFPELAQFRASVVASVNQEFAEWRAPLSSGDEVAFLPPVSGGAIPAGRQGRGKSLRAGAKADRDSGDRRAT